MNADVLLEHFHRLGDAPDAVPRLRRFILDLAVRGKLVVQDRNDEPASALLARIDAHVAKAVKAGTLRKQLDKVELEDLPYELPGGWHWVHFGRIAEFSAGRTPSRNDHSFWNTGDYPWVSIADLIDDGVVVETKETVSRKAKSLFGGDPSAKGTMIMSFKLTIGKISRLGVDAYHNEAIISIHPHESKLDGYLFKVLPECSRAGKTKDAIKGATLNRDSIHNILIPLPPLPEQHRIVAKVDELMALCDRLEAAQQEREQRRTRLTAASWQALTAEIEPNAARFALEQLPALTTRPQQIAALRQTILDLAVRGRLVKQDKKDELAEVLLKRIAKQRGAGEFAGKDWAADESGDVPAAFPAPIGWKWTRIAATVQRVTVGFVGSMKDQYVDKGIPFLRSQNVRANQFRPTGLVYISEAFHRSIIKSVVYPGDVVVVRSGNVGTACVVPEAIEVGNCSDLVVVQRPIAVHPAFLCFYLNSLAAVHIEAGAVGVALTHFNTKSVANMPFPLPPLAEQRRIVAKVDELMRLCDALEAALVRGEEVKGRLLEAVLHTEVVPRTQPPSPVQLRMATGAPKPQRAYAEAEVELAMAAEPVDHNLQMVVVRRGRGRPPKDEKLTTSASRIIEDFLKQHPGWHGKAHIVDATGMDASLWTNAINDLLASGKVEREGVKKGARYRAADQ